MNKKQAEELKGLIKDDCIRIFEIVNDLEVNIKIEKTQKSKYKIIIE